MSRKKAPQKPFKKQPPFRFHDIFQFMSSLYAEDLHSKRVYSLANATLGVMTSAALGVQTIGAALAQARGLFPKHAVKQVDRLLSNPGIDVWLAFSKWVPYVLGAREEVVLAMDWTDFAHDEHATIMISMVTRHGRATPLVWRTVKKDELKEQRNDHEDEVLRRLRDILAPQIQVTILADRGFGDQKLFDFLEYELGFGYVIRFRDNTYVTNTKGERRKAAQWLSKSGRARTLRNATITAQDSAVNTIVCVHDKGMKEPWCLAASDITASARTLINYYAKRWGIETAFRDTKDLRFGMGMSLSRIKSTQRRDRLFLLNAFAIVLLTLLGAACEASGYDRYLKTNTSKKRTHSLFRQGCMVYDLMPNMPDKWLTLIMQQFETIIDEHNDFNDVYGYV
jgi:hypothetical protein